MQKSIFTTIWNFPFLTFIQMTKKQFWKVVRHFVKSNIKCTSSSIPPLNSFSVTGQNDYCFSSEEKADLLNKYFTSISTVKKIRKTLFFFI